MKTGAERAAATLIRSRELLLLRAGGPQALELTNALLCDDFVEFGQSGGRYDKSACLHAIEQRTESTGWLTEFVAHSLSPSWIHVTYRAWLPRPDGTVSQSLRSSLWRLDERGWRMAFHQGTMALDG